MRRILSLGLVVVACAGRGDDRSGAPRPPQPAPAAAAPAAASDPAVHAAARRLELGQGGQRDFMRAASLYRAACADGCGDLTACRHALRLAIAGRGPVVRPDDVRVLHRMCQRGDRAGCGAAQLLDLVMERTSAKVSPPGPTCQGGDAAACDAAVLLDPPGLFWMPPIDGPPVLPSASQRDAALQVRLDGDVARLCERGDLHACVRLLDRWPVRCVDGDAACVTQLGQDARRLGAHPGLLEAAWTTLDRGCTDGDVDACAVTRPGALDAPALCAAGDLLRCLALAGGGDADASKRACAAGLTAACGPGPVQLSDPLRPLLDELGTRAAACRGGQAAACAGLDQLTGPAACP
jgi:hypothetical protein